MKLEKALKRGYEIVPLRPTPIASAIARILGGRLVSLMTLKKPSKG